MIIMGIKKLSALCKAGVHIEINGHKDMYQSVDSYLSDYANYPAGMRDKVIEKLDISKSVYSKMVELDTVVKVQFYPHTPIGSYTVYGFDVDSVIDECIAVIEEL